MTKREALIEAFGKDFVSDGGSIMQIFTNISINRKSSEKVISHIEKVLFNPLSDNHNIKYSNIMIKLLIINIFEKHCQ